MSNSITEKTYAGELCFEHIGLTLQSPVLNELGRINNRPVSNGIPIIQINSYVEQEGRDMVGKVRVTTLGGAAFTFNRTDKVTLVY